MSEEQLQQDADQTQVVSTDTAAVVELEAPKVADTSWIPKRIGEITAARRAAEERAQRAEEELSRYRTSQAADQVSNDNTHQAGTVNASVEQLARAYAERMVREQSDQQALSTKIAAINAAGAKEFGDEFEKSVQNLQMAGIGGADFLRVLTSVPSAEKIVTYLGKSENINEALRIGTLDPVQMGIEIMKLSTHAAKSLSKQISKLPAPAATIDGSGTSDGHEPSQQDTDAWIKWRNQTKKTRR